MRRAARTAMAATLLLLAAACADDEREPAEAPTTSSAAASEAPSETESAPTEPVEPAQQLEWQPTGHGVDERVVVGESWTALAQRGDVRFESTTGGDDVVLDAVTSGEVDALLLDGETAVVSYSFGGEVASGLGYRVDLSTGEQIKIVVPEPANGGDWALVDNSLYYPGLAEDGRACLATLAVADGNGEDGWCPPGRVGIAELDANEHGVAAMLFDYGSDISCRTLTLLDRAGVPQPVDGPGECIGWDIAATSTGIIFSEVPRPRRQERAVFSTITEGGQPQILAKGTTGSLVSCGGDAFFVSDPTTASEPARLMRWDGTDLSVAYQSASKGNAFLGRPECADGILTISSFGEDGDEQVYARVS
ncbi:MAG: hypothetical protein JWN68_342 [Nocardioides sp.]|jgi:hypothetical protein|uniref:hypothetical protein n=1 Tax=Nocardioides sp. TaxID=35761 RepID=UPI00260BE0F8|nr:hypothetical protein [Nocardioides sp.]MCW2832389.1 hypothetical protein [Nocardioides sp.]